MEGWERGAEGNQGLIANSGSEKIGNGWVDTDDLLEEVNGLKVGESGR